MCRVIMNIAITVDRQRVQIRDHRHWRSWVVVGIAAAATMGKSTDVGHGNLRKWPTHLFFFFYRRSDYCNGEKSTCHIRLGGCKAKVCVFSGGTKDGCDSPGSFSSRVEFRPRS
jgi:hypothetical protein